MMNQTFDADIATIDKIEAVRQILEVACRATGMRFSAVARVTEARWIACAVRDEIEFGLLPGGELDLKTTLCDEIRQNHQEIAIDHVALDATFCGHRTPQIYGFQSYISVPIWRPDGRFFGTLCALDPKPAAVNNQKTIGMFKLFADLIGQHLDAQERLARSEAQLQRERETAELRERFIAVLGHDLRNPLGALDAGLAVLESQPADADNAPIIAVMRRSSARINGLIGDVLDFTRARMGLGVVAHRVRDGDLQSQLEQVVAELQLAWPNRAIESDFSILHPVNCDGARLAQMLSNLLVNALTHGTPGTPGTAIEVRGESSPSGLQISVSNASEAIDPKVMEQLFEPFSARTSRSDVNGLGLGLYIASEIARAHNGNLEVRADDGQVCVTFSMG